MNYRETFKEVNQDEFYKVIGSTCGIGSIVNLYERTGLRRGYITEMYSDYKKEFVVGISECGDFPFTKTRFFLNPNWKQHE